jgi:hypothetical protein
MGSMMTMGTEARRKMGASGRERMVAEFDIERVVDKWVEMFQGLLTVTIR